MKKFLFIIPLLLLNLACSNMKTNDVSNFFVAQNKSYNGGFENSGYSVNSKIVHHNGNTFLIEKTTDTATTVERIYILLDDKIELLSTKEEENTDLNSLDLNNGEIVLKEPLKIGNSWESKGNRYKIVDVNEKYISVEKVFPSGIIENSIYEKNVGKIKKIIKI